MKYTVWKWSDKQGDWRRVKSKQPWQKEYRTSVTGRRASQLLKKGKKRGWVVTARPSAKGKPKRPPQGKRYKTRSDKRWMLIRTWLSGDLDAKEQLLYALALVSRDLGTQLYVAEGQRSIKDQWKYWIAYRAGRGPLAAFPGTSNHTNGDAADVRQYESKGSRNIGDIQGARTAMARHNLCLPVPGESWHVEIGKVWKG